MATHDSISVPLSLPSLLIVILPWYQPTVLLLLLLLLPPLLLSLLLLLLLLAVLQYSLHTHTHTHTVCTVQNSAYTYSRPDRTHLVFWRQPNI